MFPIHATLMTEEVHKDFLGLFDATKRICVYISY